MVFEGISIVVEILKEGKTIENIINELLVLTIGPANELDINIRHLCFVLGLLFSFI